MKSRYKAEAQTMCDAGLASYLRDKHQSRVSKGVSAGLGTGTIVSLLFFGYSHYTGEKISHFYRLLPLFIGSITGTGYGLVTSDMDDALHTADYDVVCDALEAEQEEEAEDESDGDSEDAE